MLQELFAKSLVIPIWFYPQKKKLEKAYGAQIPLAKLAQCPGPNSRGTPVVDPFFTILYVDVICYYFSDKKTGQRPDVLVMHDIILFVSKLKGLSSL